MTAHQLPPFPTDDDTLNMLLIAVDPWHNGASEATQSSVNDFLDLMSRMGGSDPHAVEEEHGDTVVLRDPQYTLHDVVIELVKELRFYRDRWLNQGSRV